MRRIISTLTLFLVLPLAACFDMDMTISFPDHDNAEAKMVMTMSPEFYQMSSSGGDDPCDTGTGTATDDGGYICTDTKSGSIDELMADPDMAKGLTIERRDGGQLYVAFDLKSLTSDMAPPEDEAPDPDMMDMLKQAFTGHAITISVAGAKIVDTNGTVSEDGKSATFSIPLEKLLDQPVDLPEDFHTVLEPGT